MLTVSVAAVRRSTQVDEASSLVREFCDSMYVRNGARSPSFSTTSELSRSAAF